MKTYTIREVSEMLNVGYTTVYDWITKGKLDSVKIYHVDPLGCERRMHVVTEESLNKFKETYPYKYWRKELVISSRIDDVARENLEMLYGARDSIDKEIRKYEKVLSIMNEYDTY